MKRILVSLSIAALFFIACKKQDITPADLAATGDEVPGHSRNGDKNLQSRVVVSGLNFPWEILWGPDGYIWMTERQGRVSRVNPRTGQVIPVATIADVASTTNFNGLLGMALHPNFRQEPYVFVVYNYFAAGGEYLEKIVRFRYDGTTLVSPMILVDSIVGKVGGDFIHNGSRLAIGYDGKLYATTGDADRRFEFPQNPQSLNGKVLRVNLDGSIPAGNPYGNAVWSIGDRNAQGMVFAKGKLYTSMHGETTNDEINIIRRRGNNGWPYVEGFCDLPAERIFCRANDVNEPIFAWTPTIAPSGLDYYNDDRIDRWKNSLLLAVLKDKKLIQLKLNDDGSRIKSTHEFFVNQFGRLRDIAISPSGKVYICTDNGDNQDVIVEITSKGRGGDD